ncbi:MAG: SpaA isopeptide-forming pilin-related protein [Desulfuromonadaceae bacterium]
MSSMTPVVLVSLPNLPYLLGTFDTTQFRQWWRSAPFPDELENIKKGFHIYGRTHLALAQRKDGRWAVYRSKNYGIDWEGVFLGEAGEIIYDIVLITFGRAILNTSRGFFETVNAGTTWSLVLGVLAAPNAPAFCNIGGGDVLMCTDGRYIWRSTDIARSWTAVLDMRQVWHRKYSTTLRQYTGPSLPCISGANGRVFVAHGPFLLRSDDGGLTFHIVIYWESSRALVGGLIPPEAVVWDRIWKKEEYLTNPCFLISQILISSIDGPMGDDVVFCLKINDVRPVAGYTDLFAWTFKTWTSNPVSMKNQHFKIIFQQYLTPSDSGNHLDSFEVAVLGQNYNDKLIFSAQTRIDAGGNRVPSLKYSVDGGENWIDIDITNIKIGDPEGGGNYGGSMMDDNFAKLTWVGPACCNSGHYDFIELSRRQCQSYEADVCVEKRIAPPPPPDIINIRGTKTEFVTSTPLAGWTITLRHSNGDTHQVQTDPSGNYAFLGLPRDIYSVYETIQSGWICDVPNAGGRYDGITSAEGSGTVEFVRNFSNHHPVPPPPPPPPDIINIRGTKKEFVTSTPLAGWTITLRHSNGDTHQVQTDLSGNYAFLGLPRDIYSVYETIQSGWICDVPNAGGRYDGITSAEGSGTVEFVKNFSNHHRLTTEMHLDACLSKNVSVNDLTDAKLEATRTVNDMVDGLLEGPHLKSYRLTRYCEALISKSVSVDAIVSQDVQVNDSLDAHIWAQPVKYYKLGVFLTGKTILPYSMEVIIARYDLMGRLSKIERKLPQFLDIDVPNIPYGPYDSKKETV